MVHVVKRKQKKKKVKRRANRAAAEWLDVQYVRASLSQFTRHVGKVRRPPAIQTIQRRCVRSLAAPPSFPPSPDGF